MADPGAGAKFVPANLNRSYGRQSKVSTGNPPSGARFGPGWARPGGGGSMMVLPRSHGLQKAAGSKLSVPPPLNLPSRRKEHQGFDLSGSSSGVAAPAGGGSRPGSSGVGWTKPDTVVVALREGERGLGNNVVVDPGVVPKGTGPVGSAYLPPSARMVGSASSAPLQGYSVPLVEKVTVLRGEDFPSLKAALPSTNLGPEKKQKDGVVQKQKLARIEEMPTGLQDGSTSSVLLDMRPHVESKSSNRNYGRDENEKLNCGSRVSLVGVERNGKQEDYTPGMLPWVHMSPRSDWEDDERDTGHTLVDRGRHQGYSRSEAYWERDFNFPRPGNFPQKPLHNLLERSGFPANDIARMSPRDFKAGTSGKHIAAPGRDGREGNSWKAPLSLSKEGHNIFEAGNERDASSVMPSGKKIGELDKLPSAFQDHSRDESGSRGNAVYNQGGKQPWSSKMDPSVGQGLQRNSRDHYGNEQLNRHKGEHFQNNFGLRSSSSSSGGKMVAVYDPVLNFGRDKHKHYVEDPKVKDMWMSDFDGSDHFSVGLVGHLGLVKKKKEVLKQTEFHDPVRESFEAELERVQKMQEIERQRNLEEKERAMELPRREEEERIRLARKQEEQQRRLEEEAQETAWRVEQQRVEAMQKAEEQRLAREEARRKTLIEEERRKEAARRKLLELEEMIANRQAEAASSAISSSGFTDEKSSGMALKKDVLKVPDGGEWEDNERVTERITTSTSSDFLMINRPFEIGSKHGPVAVLDRGKAVGSWKNDALDIRNRSSLFQPYQGNELHSPKWDASVGGRLFPRRKYQGEPRLVSLGASQKEGSSAPLVDELGQSKSQGWDISWDREHYTRTLDIELQQNIEDRCMDPGWGQNRPGENVYPLHREGMQHNPEDEGMYSFGRSRYSMRQPRVLPPPSFSLIHRIPVRSEHKHPGPSTFDPNEMLNNHGAGNEPTTQTKLDDGLWERSLEAGVVDAQYQNTRFEGQKLDGGSARCDSASSFSVSSPPGTPAHLSYDDSEESGNSPVLSAKGNIDDEGKDCVVLPSEAVKADVLHSGVVSTAEEEEEEEEEEEWAVDNNVELQHQEEYDEEGSYEEEDGVDGKDKSVKLVQELDGEMFEGNDSPDTDNSVLCFNEGVEVKMPNDEFERCSRNEGNLHSADGSAPTSNDFSIEDEAAAQMSTTMELPSQSDPESSVLTNQSQIPSLSSEAVQSTATSIPNQPDVPLNLQFGLFSSPPLIPSPVQAIQIGSIQMPLHLHPPIGPSLGNKHQLQPTLFHFGQLRYTSPISPEILPLATQSLSYGNINIPNDTESKSGTVVPPRESANDSTKLQHSSRDLSHVDEHRSTPEVGIQAENSCTNNLETSLATTSADEHVFGSVPPQLVPNRGNFGMSKSQGPSSGGRGRRYVGPAKFGSRLLLPTPDASHQDSGEFHRRPRRQHTEFRIRENPQGEGYLASQRTYSYGRQHTYTYDRSSNIGRGGGARSSIGHMPNRQAKQTSQFRSSSWQPVTSLRKDTKVCEEESSKNGRNLPYSEEHDDTSWQGGIGSNFKKPDIETPGDDDFIEVRSRRQMLNERHAQREKEIKAKSRLPKLPRKLHPTSQAIVGYARLNKAPAISTVSNNFSSDCITAERRTLIRASETSAGTKTPSVSQPLPPIRTPTVKNGVNAKADKSSQQTSSQQTRSVQTSSSVFDGGKSLTPEPVYDSGDKLLDDVQITQQVMALTQTQLDEAMQPAHFDSCPAVGDSKNKVGEPSRPLPSTLNKDVDSSLSGKKIQFAQGCCSLFSEKEQNVSRSSLPLQDCEAAASAVVAAISGDENGLANNSLSVNAGYLGGANIDGIAAKDGSCNLQSQIRRDEPLLNITLPADLSVETPHVPLWPPLSSPQNASVPMLSHVPGGLPGHFQFYEINPLVEGHMFAFGRPAEPVSSQSQYQQNNVILPGPLGTWQHHSNIESIYGLPVSFAGPFIGPPGSVAGVQGPAHMVVYNHLVPVGHNGQVGLNFMGTTYVVPSGEQTDLKHIPASSRSA